MKEGGTKREAELEAHRGREKRKRGAELKARRGREERGREGRS